MEYKFSSDLWKCLYERGFLHQVTDAEALDDYSNSEQVVAYIGFDCTADCLHVGSMVQIMMLRWIQHFGHKPIVVLGGGTTKVGDPSGKDQARQLLSGEKINANMQAIHRLMQKFIQFGELKNDAILVDNALWLDDLEYIAFLRDFGKHFSINRMLGFESVAARMQREQPLSFLEFNYMLLQAYDFVELQKRYSCRVQIGGSDQWGNIVSGIDLGRRVLQTPLYGWTAPLITTSSGAKMGKTQSGAVWLDAKHYSSYDYWQFWRNTADADVDRFLRLFTDLPLTTIAELTQEQGQALNQAKIVLANWQTRLCHGAAAAEAAQRSAQSSFANAGLGDELPRYFFDDTQPAVLLTHILLELGFAASNSAGRRLLTQGAVRLDNVVIDDVNYTLGPDDFVKQSALKLSCGKKRFAVIEKK